MNKVQLMGRLTKDIELKYTTSDEPTAVARFTVAINRPKIKEREQEADFINCTAFGKRAETIAKYFSKGSLIALCGSWRTGSYKKDDKTVYTNECLISEFFFTDSSKNNSSNDNTNDTNEYDSSQDYDDDLPF